MDPKVIPPPDDERCPMLHAYYGERRGSQCALALDHDDVHVRPDGEGDLEIEQDHWFLPDAEDCNFCHGLVCDWVCGSCGVLSTREGCRTLAGAWAFCLMWRLVGQVAVQEDRLVAELEAT